MKIAHVEELSLELGVVDPVSEDRFAADTACRDVEEAVGKNGTCTAWHANDRTDDAPP